MFPLVLEYYANKPHHILSDLRLRPWSGSRGLSCLVGGEGFTEGLGWMGTVLCGSGLRPSVLGWAESRTAALNY